MAAIHVLGRLVIVDEGHILLARYKPEDYFFLPGGHVEYNERTEDALKREIHEEMGRDLMVGAFIGALENRWNNHGESYHELNLVFSGSLANVKFPEVPFSLEGQLDFSWQSLDRLVDIDLRPVLMVSVIQDFVEKGVTGRWWSSIE